MRYEALTEYGSITAWVRGVDLVYEFWTNQSCQVETLVFDPRRTVPEYLARDWDLVTDPFVTGVVTA